MGLTWRTALAWRMRRQLLDPAAGGSVVDVVRRVGPTPAWPDPAMELTVGARRTDGRSGEAARALAARELVKVFAFRGALHLMTPQDAGAYLAVRGSSRMWERPGWREFYELEPDDWPAFRATVREILADGELTRSELLAELGRRPRYRRVHEAVTANNWTVLKPLSWQGDMGLGPGRDGEATFLRLSDVPGWAGVPEVEEAGPTVLVAHLRSNGPTSEEQLHDRFGKGLGAGRREVTRWLARLGDRLARVTIEGDDVLVLTDDLDDLRATPASSVVRLLPARDPWLTATGTAAPRVLAPARRDVASRNANLVVHGGAVAGTWTLRGDRLAVAWFGEAGRVPRTALGEEADRLGRFLGRPLELATAVA